MEIHEKLTEQGVELRMTDQYVSRGRTWDFGAVGNGRDREEALNDLADRAVPKQLKAVFDSMLQEQRGPDPKDSSPAKGSIPVKPETAPAVQSPSSPSSPVPPASPEEPQLSAIPEEPPSVLLSPSSETPGGIVPDKKLSPDDPPAEDEDLAF